MGTKRNKYRSVQHSAVVKLAWSPIRCKEVAKRDEVPAGGKKKCPRRKSWLAAEHPGRLRKMRDRENSIQCIRNGNSGEKNVSGGTGRQIAGLSGGGAESEHDILTGRNVERGEQYTVVS